MEIFILIPVIWWVKSVNFILFCEKHWNIEVFLKYSNLFGNRRYLHWVKGQKVVKSSNLTILYLSVHDHHYSFSQWWRVFYVMLFQSKCKGLFLPFFPSSWRHWFPLRWQVGLRLPPAKTTYWLFWWPCPVEDALHVQESLQLLHLPNSTFLQISWLLERLSQIL